MSATVGRRLFRVTDVFTLRAGRVVIATDCPLRSAPELHIGEPLEFRNPDGTMFLSTVAGIELADPPNPDRPFVFPLPRSTPVGAVVVGADEWSLEDDKLP